MATVVKDLQSAASPSAIHGQQLIPQVSHALESSSDSDAAADVYDFQTWQYDFDDEEPVVTVDDLIQQLVSYSSRYPQCFFCHQSKVLIQRVSQVSTVDIHPLAGIS